MKRVKCHQCDKKHLAKNAVQWNCIKLQFFLWYSLRFCFYNLTMPLYFDIHWQEHLYFHYLGKTYIFFSSSRKCLEKSISTPFRINNLTAGDNLPKCLAFKILLILRICYTLCRHKTWPYTMQEERPKFEYVDKFATNKFDTA